MNKYMGLFCLMLTACGGEGDKDEENLPVFRMDTDNKYALVGVTGSCSDTLRKCEFNYVLRNPCTHGSFYLVYVKERYAYIWILNDEKVDRGGWKWTVTRPHNSESALQMIYANEATTYFYCADDDLEKAGL